MGVRLDVSPVALIHSRLSATPREPVVATPCSQPSLFTSTSQPRGAQTILFIGKITVSQNRCRLGQSIVANWHQNTRPRILVDYVISHMVHLHLLHFTFRTMPGSWDRAKTAVFPRVCLFPFPRSPRVHARICAFRFEDRGGSRRGRANGHQS